MAVALPVVAHLKVIERHGVRAQPVGVIVRAWCKRVVADQGIHERLPLHQDLLATVPKKRADRHPNQDADHRHMEQDVPHLTQVTAFGPHRVLPVSFLPDLHPVAAFTKDRRSVLYRGLGGERIRVNIDRAVHGHAGKVLGGARRRFTPVFGMFNSARGNAPDQGNKQQQVDGREPPGGENIKQLYLIGKLAPAGVGFNIVRHLRGVLNALRKHRPGNRRHCQQQKQQQGGVHFRQLRPAPAEHPGDSQRRGVSVCACHMYPVRLVVRKPVAPPEPRP